MHKIPEVKKCHKKSMPEIYVQLLHSYQWFHFDLIITLKDMLECLQEISPEFHKALTTSLKNVRCDAPLLHHMNLGRYLDIVTASFKPQQYIINRT